MSTPPSPLATPVPWDLVADSYTAEVVPMFEHFAETALALAAPPEEARIVDVACGPGTLALLAARRAAHVDAIDFSPAMIERLKARCAAAGITKIEADVGDGMALPYADHDYDAAFSMFGLMFFPDRGRGFAELRRVLRRGCRAVVSSWVPLSRVPLLAATFASLRTHVPDLPPPPATFPLSTPDDFRAEMVAAGFRDVAIHEVVRSNSAPSVVDVWAMFQRSNAPIAMTAKRLGPAWPAIAALIEADLLARFGAGPQTEIMPALLGVGTA
jgi:SAM-dependent methyltransferase